MPIDSLHPQYVAALPQWTLVSDVLAGEAQVKNKGADYLPKLSEQEETDYQAYKGRALFVNATERTHESHVGFLFRKDPVVTTPTALKDLINDCTLTGYAFYDYLKDVAGAALSLGRYGTLVDWDSITQRPFFRTYRAEQIINWRKSRIKSKMVLTKLVVAEVSDEYNGSTGELAPPDEFVYNEYPQWRVFDVLLDNEGEPFVRCQVWRRKLESTNTKKGGPTGGTRATNASSAATGVDSSWILVREDYPARRGAPLADIPFVFHGPNNHSADVDKIPLENLARINLSHYRTSADLENGRHFTGLPTAYAAGFGTEDKLYLGSTVAWVTSNAEAKAGFVEFTGQGLRALSDAIKEKQEQMASVGARMFDAEKGKGAEAYDTTKIKQTGETVTLTNAALALSQSCSKVLQLALWWITPSAATPEDLAAVANVLLNTEFVSTKLTSLELTALVSAWQMKAISYETLFYNLQTGEMYKDDTTLEDEADLIAHPTVDFQMAGNGVNGLQSGNDQGNNGGAQDDGTGDGGTGGGNDAGGNNQGADS